MNTKQIFETAGMSYEYPGYYAADVGAYHEMTVGINSEGCDENPPVDTEFSVQIVFKDGGGCLSEQNIVGATNVVAVMKLLKEVMP